MGLFSFLKGIHLIALTQQAQIHEAATSGDPELQTLISNRIDELAEFGPIDELAHFLIVEHQDDLDAIDAHLGFSVLERPVDVIERHAHWFELTYVLRDDGFGVVLFVPMEGASPPLLDLCRQHHMEM